MWAVLLSACYSAAAVSAPALPAAYRHWFESAVASGACPHIAVGLLDQGDEGSWFFDGSGTASHVGRDSVFEIGALTEVFTGVLAARAAIEGKLRLSDPVAGALQGAAGASNRLASTSIEDLITQHSGLPPTPPNLFPARADDPYADYRQQDLVALLEHLPSSASADAYSPLGSAVLGMLLGRAYGSEYKLALFERVLVPLGLAHTGFGDPDGLLPGTARGQPAAHWHYAALAPAAGLRSTLGDLLTFARANLLPELSPLRAALLLARQPRARDANGGVAIGWHVHDVAMDEQTWPLIWRASETGGFSAFIGFRTDRQQALVLLADATVPLAPLGLAWLGDQALPPAPQAPYLPAPAILDRYPGLYRLLDGREITIRHASDALTAQLRGQPPFALMPLSEDVYASAGGSVGITFVRNIDEIGGLLLQANGAFVTAQLLSQRAPRLARNPIALEPARLREYIGDFRIDDDLMLRVATVADALTMQYTGAAPVALHAYATDRFAAEDGIDGIVFRRDDAGRVAAVTLQLAGGEREASPVYWRSP